MSAIAAALLGAAVIGGGMSIGGGMLASNAQSKQNKKTMALQRELMNRQNQYVKPLDQTGAGLKLIDILGSGETGIPPHQLQNMNELLKRRGGQEIDRIRAEGLQLGGSTGTSQSSLLRDMGMRNELNANLGVGEQINQNSMQDILMRKQDRQYLGNLALGASALERQTLGGAGGGNIPALPNPAAVGFTTAGNIAQGFSGLNLGSYGGGGNSNTAYLDRQTNRQSNVQRSALPKSSLASALANARRGG